MRRSPVIAAFCIVSCAFGCSSKNGGKPDSGDLFGSPDSSSAEASSSQKPDAGSKKDTGIPGEKSDGACGSVVPGPTWCQTNAPMETDESNVLCDDFDTGVLSTAYQWEGLTQASFVNTRYVSPNCALSASVTTGSDIATTEHTYDSAPATGGATMAFDLYVPGSACEGVVVGWVNVIPGVTTPAGSLLGWIKLTQVSSSDYTATLSMATSSGGKFDSATPVSVHVTPRSSDKGWARLSLTVESYTLAATPTATTGAATISWYAIGGKTAEATSSAINASGQIATVAAPDVNFYVGVLTDPASGDALTGCELVIDDFVTNLTGASGG
jgi:hypothetical protein